MGEFNNYFYVVNGSTIREPVIQGGIEAPPIVDRGADPLSPEQFLELRDQFARDMEDVAPDLKSYGLAEHYVTTLFNKLVAKGATSLEQLVSAGSREFYAVGRDVLGPLAVSFVDTVLREAHGQVIFPARDATPFFYAAKTLKTLHPDAYPVALEDIHNPVFNRKLWGINDELDPESPVLPVTHPLVQGLLKQMGLLSEADAPVAFAETGCWGSMIDQLNRAMQVGAIPNQPYSVYFLYTHLPEFIYGFLNQHGGDVPESALEAIADTWEAFPRAFKRPTELIEVDGTVKASLDGKLVASPFLPAWSHAALQGIVDAAAAFAASGAPIDVNHEIHRLWDLSHQAQAGQFTGMLSGHTETWSEGEAWKAAWKWGQVPPLKGKGSLC